MSTILTAATKREWTLGTKIPSTQEEIQMLRIGDALLIACNKDGHSEVQNFLTAFGVNSDATFIDSLKYSHAIMNETKPTNWRGDVKDRAKYSAQDSKTINAFTFPSGIPKIPSVGVLNDIYNCVGKAPKKNDPAPTSPKDWKVGPFQQLLGVYADSGKTYEKGYAAPATAKFQNAELNQTPKLDYAVTVITDKSTVHAELKLLAILTRMVIEDLVKVKDVQLGGAKGACKKCAVWIQSYSGWLSSKGITLQLPQNDTRVSADPLVEGWNKPTVDITITGNESVKELIPGLFS